LPGNHAAVGNPLAARVQKIRAQLIAAMTPAAVRRIAAALIRLASKGDVSAAKVLFSWSLGEPVALDIMHRLEQLEAALRGDGCPDEVT
jgi:hypothetical protein